MKILVSLPKNSIELAQAVLAAGADGVKVHLNAFHRASGSKFGSFEEERPFLEELSSLKSDRFGSFSKYIMVGQETLPTAQEIFSLSKMGFEGFNLYLKDARPHLFNQGLRPILAVDHHYSKEDVLRICEDKSAWIEASVVPFENYGTPLQEEDLKRYRQIVEWSQGREVIIPSQKKLLSKDFPALKGTGAYALLLGVLAIGSTPDQMSAGIKQFVEARSKARSQTPS